MIRVKEEAKEWSGIDERKATEAERDEEAYEMKLECLNCFELDKQSCPLITCGHVMCHDCS